MPRLLIVDDEPKLLRLLHGRFEEEGYSVLTAARTETAEPLLNGANIDLLITDVRLPGRSGIELLKAARAAMPDLQVIIISAYGTVAGAVEAMRLGAFDYVLKPFEMDALVLVAGRALDMSRLRQENTYLRSRDRQIGPGQRIIADSPCMREVLTLLERVAPTDTTVLIRGESGVGKERVAEAIHEHSRRRDGPFIRVNCPAIPKELVESELFGHVRGAFTGASESRKGRFEIANGGTLFLDEVGDLPLEQQGKLLCALETRKFSRVGSVEETHSDVRLLAATHRDLKSLVRNGAFRADLYYRLDVFPITVPPLRERSADLPGLVEELLRRLTVQLGRPKLQLEKRCFQKLERYPWPGNVRELRNVLERAAVLSQTDLIVNLPPLALLDDTEIDEDKGNLAEDLVPGLEEYKVRRLVDALVACGWKKKEAAERLGLSPRAMSYYIRRYDLEKYRQRT